MTIVRSPSFEKWSTCFRLSLSTSHGTWRQLLYASLVAMGVAGAVWTPDTIKVGRSLSLSIYIYHMSEHHLVKIPHSEKDLF